MPNGLMIVSQVGFEFECSVTELQQFRGIDAPWPCESTRLECGVEEKSAKFVVMMSWRIKTLYRLLRCASSANGDVSGP